MDTNANGRIQTQAMYEVWALVSREAQADDKPVNITEM
jgi:hypothetical protein